MRFMTYFLVIDQGKPIGRHYLQWDELPPELDRQILRRWYKDYPDATMSKDTDQESTHKGRFFVEPTYSYQRKAREALRSLLRFMSKAEITAELEHL